tara:strand:- start:301 stop:1053 length:753 start_codon:yes stop_codon:yes gene_type:complete
MIKVLDICSGIGGFSLGLESTGKFETVAFCENESFCKKVLNKHWPDVPIYNDLKELGNDPEKIQEEFDLICGGVPCQPFSVAGRKKGKEDDRYLWPYMFEIIKHKTPSWVIVENVGGFVNVALDDVCLDLETEGYSTQSFVIPACGIEAPHRRDRVWIIGRNMADTNTKGLQRGQKTRNFEESRQGREQLLTRQSEFFRGKNWESEPAVGRMANGIPNRVDRLKALGNAIVPQIIYHIGLAIYEEMAVVN